VYIIIDLKWWVFTALLIFYNIYRKNFKKKDIIEKSLGKYCKIITKETREGKTHTISGIISGIDQDEGEIVMEATKGVFYLKVDTIKSIKPRKRFGRNK